MRLSKILLYTSIVMGNAAIWIPGVPVQTGLTGIILFMASIGLGFIERKK